MVLVVRDGNRVDTYFSGDWMNNVIKPAVLNNIDVERASISLELQTDPEITKVVLPPFDRNGEVEEKEEDEEEKKRTKSKRTRRA